MVLGTHNILRNSSYVDKTSFYNSIAKGLCFSDGPSIQRYIYVTGLVERTKVINYHA